MSKTKIKAEDKTMKKSKALIAREAKEAASVARFKGTVVEPKVETPKVGAKDTAASERQKVVNIFGVVIKEKFESKMPIKKIVDELAPQIKKTTTLSPVNVVYFALNVLNLKKTAVQQRILEKESK